MAFPKCTFPAPVPCRILPGLRAGKSPSGMGHKQRTQEGCDRAPAMSPSKSLLEMQKRARNFPLCKKRSPGGSLLPSRICPSNRRLRQRRCRRCILLLMLSEDGWAGGDGTLGRRVELCTASQCSAAGAPRCLFILPACGFHFLLGEGVGSCNKSCHRQSFNL